MKKLFALLPLYLIFTSLVSAQSFEGTITYQIKYLQVPEEVKGMESMLPQETRTTIKNQKVRVEQSVMGGSQVVIANEADTTGAMLMDMMGMKIAITMSKEEIQAEADSAGVPTLEYVSGTRKILGYTCKKALRKDKNGDMEIYYTEEIPNLNKDLKGLKGMPLYYKSRTNGMLLEMTATNVKKESVEDSMFEIPDEYDVQTLTEFTNANGVGK